MAALEERSYGDPRMPDWFDEAVAVLCEPEDMRAERREAMRRGVGSRRSLTDFFAMDYPAAGHTAPAGVQPEAEQRSRRPRITITRGDTGEPDLFYPQALSVAEFLIEREGPEVIGRLAEGFARELSVDDMLLQGRNLPEDVNALEAEWLRWLEG
ncbi:MAG: hypothetical protein H0X65_12155 [Gemmatimonadetes bacterium]|nr:hypothetical protein [Gemmatimonadota bacterium]